MILASFKLLMVLFLACVILGVLMGVEDLQGLLLCSCIGAALITCVFGVYARLQRW